MKPMSDAAKRGDWVFIYRDGWSDAPKARWTKIDGGEGWFWGWEIDPLYRDQPGVCEGVLGYDEDADCMPTHWGVIPVPRKPSSPPQP